MQHVKAAFLTKDALAVVVGLVAEPLSSSANMTEQAAHMVQLVVTFVRNLLCIPDCSATAGMQTPMPSILKSCSTRIGRSLVAFAGQSVIWSQEHGGTTSPG